MSLHLQISSLNINYLKWTIPAEDSKATEAAWWEYIWGQNQTFQAREIDDNLLNYYQRPSRRRKKRRGDPKMTHGNMSYIKKKAKSIELRKSKHHCGYFIVCSYVELLIFFFFHQLPRAHIYTSTHSYPLVSACVCRLKQTICNLFSPCMTNWKNMSHYLEVVGSLPTMHTHFYEWVVMHVLLFLHTCV